MGTATPTYGFVPVRGNPSPLEQSTVEVRVASATELHLPRVVPGRHHEFAPGGGSSPCLGLGRMDTILYLERPSPVG